MVGVFSAVTAFAGEMFESLEGALYCKQDRVVEVAVEMPWEEHRDWMVMELIVVVNVLVPDSMSTMRQSTAR